MQRRLSSFYACLIEAGCGCFSKTPSRPVNVENRNNARKVRCGIISSERIDKGKLKNKGRMIVMAGMHESVLEWFLCSRLCISSVLKRMAAEAMKNIHSAVTSVMLIRGILIPYQFLFRGHRS